MILQAGPAAAGPAFVLVTGFWGSNGRGGGPSSPGEGLLVTGFPVAVAGAVPLAEGDRRGRGVAGPLA